MGDAAREALFHEDDWKLIFAQDGMIEGITKPEDWMKERKCTRSSPVCSELGTMADYEQPHGGYWFKMVWPELASPLGDWEQEWKQAAPPAPKQNGTKKVQGYADVNAPFIEKNWGGLQYNGVSCLWDGSVGSGEGFYQVGAVMEYKFMGTQGGFKGPGVAVHGVKLYTKLPSKTIRAPSNRPTPAIPAAIPAAISAAVPKGLPKGLPKFPPRAKSAMRPQDLMPRPVKRLVRGAWRQFKNALRS